VMTAEPLWHRVYGDLRDRIQAGEMEPGDRLPSEPTLMAAHGVRSRETIRKAVRALAGEGLIDGQRRVSQRHPITLRVSDEESVTFIQDLAAAGHIASPPQITVKIEGDRLVREVLRVVDGEPHNWARWRFPLEAAQGTRLAYDTDIPEGSIKYLKEGLGWAGLRQDKWIEVRPPTPLETAILSPPPGWNVIVQHRAGTRGEFDAELILRADRTRLIP
jgi:DNA-binding transcriptional regulator YhcF (GntR family)